VKRSHGSGLQEASQSLQHQEGHQQEEEEVEHCVPQVHGQTAQESKCTKEGVTNVFVIRVCILLLWLLHLSYGVLIIHIVLHISSAVSIDDTHDNLQKKKKIDGAPWFLWRSIRSL
jgi:hypothetical protein